jgi:hypothetical protein
VKLIVGGEARTLDSHSPSGRRTLLVVAPVGAPIQLVVTDQGRTQSLDLRTGKRGDAVAGFYTAYAADDLELRSERRMDPDAGTLFASGDLFLAPWTPANGWAPSGKAWLVFDTGMFQILGWVKDSTLDVKRSFSVVAGGRTYPAQADNPTLYAAASAASGRTLIAFAVPAGLRSGTLRLTPHAKCDGCRLGPGDSTPFALKPSAS